MTNNTQEVPFKSRNNVQFDTVILKVYIYKTPHQHIWNQFFH